MATQNFNGDNAAIDYFGRWADAAGTRKLNATGSEVWLRVWGKKLQINQNNSVGSTYDCYRHQVDESGTYTTGNVPNGVSVQTIFDNPSDAWHDVRLAVYPGIAGYWGLVIADAIQLTYDALPDGYSASQLIQPHSLAPGRTSGDDIYGYQRLLDTWAAAGNIENDFDGNDTTGGYTSPSAKIATVNGTKYPAIRFRAKCSAIWLWTRLNGDAANPSKVRIGWALDGCQMPDADLPADAVLNSNRGWVKVASGLDSSAYHDYEITARGSYTDAIMVTGTLRPVTPSVKSILYEGDSITECGNPAGSTNGGNGWPHLVSMLLGCRELNRGVSGRTTVQLTGYISTDVTPFACDAIVVHSSYNDDISNMTTWRTNYTSFLTALAAAKTTAKVICTNLFRHSPKWDDEQAEIQNAIDAIADADRKAQCVFSNLTLPSDSGTPELNSYDGLHPTTIGNCRVVGAYSGAFEFSGQPNDGDTVTITDRDGVASVYEFDNNASITAGRTSVTIGASTAATVRALYDAVVAKYAARTSIAKPLKLATDSYWYSSTRYYENALLVRNVSAVAESATNVVAHGVYATGQATEVYRQIVPKPAYASATADTTGLVVTVNMSGETFTGTGTPTIKRGDGTTLACTLARTAINQFTLTLADPIYASDTPTIEWASGVFKDLVNDNVAAQSATSSSFVNNSTATGDSVAPEATCSPADLTGDGVEFYEFDVTFTDDTAVAVASLAACVSVMGEGFEETATLVSTNPETNAASIVASYKIAGPDSGLWTPDSNGAYQIAISGATDTGSNSITPGIYGSFTVNVSSVPMLTPRVVATAMDKYKPLYFTVTFTDENKVKVSTLNNIVVTGTTADGTPCELTATLVSTDPAEDAATIVATYSVGGPSDDEWWTEDLTGIVYTIVAHEGITDVDDRPLAAGAIGTFTFGINRRQRRSGGLVV